MICAKGCSSPQIVTLGELQRLYVEVFLLNIALNLLQRYKKYRNRACGKTKKSFFKTKRRPAKIKRRFSEIKRRFVRKRRRFISLNRRLFCVDMSI